MRPSCITTPVGHGQRLILVVRHHHGGNAKPLLHAAYFGAQRVAHLGIQRRKRLVEQQQLRLRRQRARKRHTLLLAARELRRIIDPEAAQVHQIEHFTGPVSAVARRWRTARRRRFRR